MKSTIRKELETVYWVNAIMEEEVDITEDMMEQMTMAMAMQDSLLDQSRSTAMAMDHAVIAKIEEEESEQLKSKDYKQLVFIDDHLFIIIEH